MGNKRIRFKMKTANPINLNVKNKGCKILLKKNHNNTRQLI